MQSDVRCSKSDGHIVGPHGSKISWGKLHDDTDPKLMLAGGSPVSVYRSEDSGASWKRMPDPNLPLLATMPFRVV